jgi:hypothetical protein
MGLVVSFYVCQREVLLSLSNVSGYIRVDPLREEGESYKRNSLLQGVGYKSYGISPLHQCYTTYFFVLDLKLV